MLLLQQKPPAAAPLPSSAALPEAAESHAESAEYFWVFLRSNHLFISIY